MNKKLIFSTVALASLMAACSDDLVVENSVAQAPVEAGRALVGEVEFAAGDMTRHNIQTGRFENGDVVRLFLMDKLDVYNGVEGEFINANGLPNYWKYQFTNRPEGIAWWNMYDLTNYISTNYAYTYDESTNKFVNPGAQLVEGNYFLAYAGDPGAENLKQITNRRDLWYWFNPNQKLTVNEDKVAAGVKNYFQAIDQKFLLGYNQLYRNDEPSKDGKYNSHADLHYVTSFAKIQLWNQSSSDFIPERVVIKKLNGGAVPTLALVQPENWEYELATEFSNAKNYGTPAPHFNVGAQFKDVCDNVLAEGLWNANSFTQADARNMTRFFAPENLLGQHAHGYGWSDAYLPYGCTDEEAQAYYQYSFEFPEGVVINSHANNSGNTQVATVLVSLPPVVYTPEDGIGAYGAFGVEIYGQKWDPTLNDGQGAWVPGILKNNGAVDNQLFTLDDLTTWEEGQDIPTGVVKFDDEAFYQLSYLRVSSTEELLHGIEARMKTSTNTQTVNFEVVPYGNGLEITDAVVEMLEKYGPVQNRTINVTFVKNTDGAPVNTHVILKAKNSYNRFNYAGVIVEAAADQTVAKGNETYEMLLINEGVTVNVNAGVNLATTIYNDGTLKVNGTATKVVNAFGITNHNTAVIANANVNILHNDANMTIKGTVISPDVQNYNDCVNCDNTTAVITVENGATLKVDSFTNAVNGKGKLINNGTVTSVENTNDSAADFVDFLNGGTVENNGLMNKIMLTNKLGATVDNNANLVLMSGSVNENGSTSVWNPNIFITRATVYNDAAVINNNDKGAIQVFDAAVSGAEESTFYWINKGIVNAYKGSVTYNIYNLGYLNVNAGSKVHLYNDGVVDSTDEPGIVDVTNCDPKAIGNREIVNTVNGGTHMNDAQGQYIISVNTLAYRTNLDELTLTADDTVVNGFTNLSKLVLSGVKKVALVGNAETMNIESSSKTSIVAPREITGNPFDAATSTVTVENVKVKGSTLTVGQNVTLTANGEIEVVKGAFFNNQGVVYGTATGEGTFNGTQINHAH